jgi:tRNA1(Val) A37 N6-methylase TrmN6
MMQTTMDTILGGRVLLEQPAAGYRAAIDPVLLAASIPAQSGQQVLELGCGAGAALLCLAARVPGLALTGVELQPDYLACATRNAARHASLGSMRVLAGDVRHLPPTVPANSYDHVLLNPPYHASAAYAAGSTPEKTLAHAMPTGALALWLKAAKGRLKHRGTVTVIYRAAGLAELLAACQGLGGICILPLWPHAGEAAKRVLVQASKGSKAPLRLLPGLVLHAADGAYRPEAQDILQHAAALL